MVAERDAEIICLEILYIKPKHNLAFWSACQFKPVFLCFFCSSVLFIICVMTIDMIKILIKNENICKFRMSDPCFMCLFYLGQIKQIWAITIFVLQSFMAYRISISFLCGKTPITEQHIQKRKVLLK